MKKVSVKGFTLIELLIVITIIGILAVIFLPTLFEGPAKARDAQRTAAIGKIQTILTKAVDLDGGTLPATSGCISINNTDPNSDFSAFISQLGGSLPKDPKGGAIAYGGVNCPTGEYYYQKFTSGSYRYALLSQVENIKTANTSCLNAQSGLLSGIGGVTSVTGLCYAVLVP